MVSTYSRSPGGHSKYLPSFTVYVLPVAISQQLSGNSATIYWGGSTAKDVGNENFLIDHVCMDLNKPNTTTTTIVCCSRFHKTLFCNESDSTRKAGVLTPCSLLFSTTSWTRDEHGHSQEWRPPDHVQVLSEKNHKDCLNFAKHSLLQTQFNQKIWGLELLCSQLERLLT